MLFFKVVAKETLTSEQLQAVASVTVNVTDLNDNNPECSQAVYRETVSENQPKSTSVVQVRRMRDTTTCTNCFENVGKRKGFCDATLLAGIY